MEAGVVSPVAKVMTDLEKLQAKRRVRDIRLWPEVHSNSPDPDRIIAYANALLHVPVPNQMGHMATHGLRSIRETILTWAWGVIKDIDPKNTNTLMADNLPSALTEEGHERVAPDVPPTSGHEKILAAIDQMQQLLPPELQPVKRTAEGVVTNIAWAIAQLRAGAQVGRSNWNGKGMWLRMQIPDENSHMTLPYIYIEYPVGHRAYPDGCRVPWLASQTDLLAEDWMIIE